MSLSAVAKASIVAVVEALYAGDSATFAALRVALGNQGSGPTFNTETIDDLEMLIGQSFSGPADDFGNPAGGPPAAMIDKGVIFQVLLGIENTIGQELQAWDTHLDQIAALTPTDGNVILGNGSAWTSTPLFGGAGSFSTLTTTGFITANTPIAFSPTSGHDFGGNLQISAGKFFIYQDSAQPGYVFERYSGSFGTLESRMFTTMTLNQFIYNWTNSTAGNAVLDFAAHASDGTNPVFIRFGRTSTTSGHKYYQFFDSGTVIQHQLASSTTDSYLCAQGGTLGVGLSNPSSSYKLDVHESSTGFIANFENDNTSGNCDGLRIKLDVASANSGNLFMNYVDGGGSVGTVVGDGTGVLYTTASDRDLKKNIEDAPSMLFMISAMRVVTFDWRRNNVSDIGLIAQELNEVFPSAVFDPTLRNASSLHVTYTQTIQVDVSTYLSYEDANPKEELSKEDKAKGIRPKFGKAKECPTEFETETVEHTTTMSALQIVKLRRDLSITKIVTRPLRKTDPGWTYWGIDASKLVPILLKGLQEVIEQNVEQFDLIAKLTTRVKALEA